LSARIVLTGWAKYLKLQITSLLRSGAVFGDRPPAFVALSSGSLNSYATEENEAGSMIRFKSISQRYPNGLTWADYHWEDIQSEHWNTAILRLIELMQEDSTDGWRLIFTNMLSSLKSSVFYTVMTAFSDWDSDYGIRGDIIKFHSQQEAIIRHYDANISKGKEAGERIYSQRFGKGNRWLFGDQMKRVKTYSSEKLREMLFQFASLGRAIPVSGWETNLSYGEKVKTLCESYSDYLEQAYLMPPSWYLLNETHCSSWLKLLIEAGVLGSGTLQTPRGFKCIAKDGHVCNSLVELEIDNWLCDQGISHGKEPPYPTHATLNPNGRLRADFLVNGIYVEYAGLMDDSIYAAKMEAKRKIAHDKRMKLLVIEPRHMKSIEGLLKKLQQ